MEVLVQYEYRMLLRLLALLVFYGLVVLPEGISNIDHNL